MKCFTQVSQYNSKAKNSSLFCTWTFTHWRQIATFIVEGLSPLVNFHIEYTFSQNGDACCILYAPKTPTKIILSSRVCEEYRTDSKVYGSSRNLWKVINKQWKSYNSFSIIFIRTIEHLLLWKIQDEYITCRAILPLI